jgi:hypothetical protein
MKSLSPCSPRVVGALRLHFYADTTANPQAECETITIFGVDRDGTLAAAMNWEMTTRRAISLRIR